MGMFWYVWVCMGMYGYVGVCTQKDSIVCMGMGIYVLDKILL